jgi:hypothetical protein
MIAPSLSLDFAAEKTLDPRVTFTRASTGTFTNAAGVLSTAAIDVPRFDHNPATGESLGLLIEEQRTNLVLRSEEFDNVYWVKTNSSIAVNTITAPDNTLTADKLVENTAASNHLFFVGGVSSTATAFTASVYAKAGERDRFLLQARNERSPSGGAQVIFNLTTQTITVVGFGDGTGTAQIESVGNGWFRCTLSVTVVTAGTTLVFALFLVNAANTANYTGDGTSGIYIWGAQLEAGAFVTSYIQTVASQVTRSADFAVLTGTNFSSWYRADEGTLYAEIIPRALVPASGVQVNDNTTDNQIRLATASVTDQGTVTVSAATQATLDGGTPTVNTNQKLALGYKVDDFALALNAGTVATDTSGAVPTVTQLQIGAEITTAGSLLVKKFAYYPRRLTNTQLQALTS